MGAVYYYYFRGGKGRNAKTPWAIAYNAGQWVRSLELRGWNWNREIYVRRTTAGEDEMIKNSTRCLGGRYESLEKLLEDERVILGAESEIYRELENKLNQYAGERIMPRAITQKSNVGGNVGAFAESVNHYSFNPEGYLYGFTGFQRGSIDQLGRRANHLIAFIWKTDDGTAVVGATVKKRRTLKFFWIAADGEVSETSEEYGQQENGGGIEQSKLSYDEYLKFIEWKYPNQADDENQEIYLKYSGLILSVVKKMIDADQVERELYTLYGEHWYRVCQEKYLSDEHFQAFVKTLWLGDLDGDESALTDEFRAPKVETIVESNGDGLGEYRIIELSDIVVSPLAPQAQRRARFSDEYLNDLAANIKKNGVINPITVRRVGSDYEIVAGECRYIASTRAGLVEIPSMVKNLSDEAAEEIQLFENLKRTDLHPLDEANWYQHLLAKNLSLKDIALKIGKNEAYVHQRLKLNDLCEEAQKDFAAGFLPIGHAMEIAKYAEDIQREILENLCYVQREKEFGYYSLAELKKDIEKDIHLSLKHAPFSRKSKELRPDGLACLDCTKRKGAMPTLFEPVESNGDDRCLNKSCYELKLVNFIGIQHQKATVEARKTNGNPEYSAPVLSTRWSPSADEKYPDILGRQSYKIIESKNEACGHAEKGVFVDGDRIGQTQLVCRKPTCETHGGNIYSSISRADNPLEVAEKKREERLIRKEEIFDIRVAARTRFRVLKEAAEQFEGLRQTEPEILREMVTRHWYLQNSHDSTVLEVFAEYVAGFFGEDTETGNHSSLYSVNRQMENRADVLTDGHLRRIAFLLLHGHLSPIYYFKKRGYESDRYVSQKRIKELAEHFQIDYRYLDAEERLNLALDENQYKKHGETFRQYFADVQNGKDVKIPRVWSSKWNPKD